MKALIFALATTVLASTTFAADSTWLLCNNKNIAVNAFEHRAGADKRETSLTMIIGDHALKGALINTDSGPVALSQAQNNEVLKTFKGKVGVNYKTKIMTLNGKLSLYGVNYDVVTRLSCQELNFK